jgi:2-amino-4-hydroxy-6-hydroxymethyldihydropteridine diphosphokinase
MPGTSNHLYALALGSNRPLSARRTPARLLDEAVALIAGTGAKIIAVSPTIETPPMGPSRRMFANAALVVETALVPDTLLETLQGIERTLGRRRFKRWGPRSIDIDIILWSGGTWNSPSLHIPHPAWRTRDFVLRPLLRAARGWRDPRSGLTVRQVSARLAKARPKPVARG